MAMPLLKHVKSDELKEHWSWVREGLARLECMGPDWVPEDCYHLLRLGLPHGAMLSIIGDKKGFLVWQRYPGDDGRGQLFILALVGNDLLRHYKELDAELDDLARQLSCRKIRHISKHTQWADLNWSLLGHVYEREL
jgi:hypothetical protein